MIMTVFSNESNLIFDQRHVSCFIFTDQRRYQKKSTVNFRVVALDPDLTPVKSGSIDIYVKDGVGQYVRRWLGKQFNQGFYEGSFKTGHPVKTGWWIIEVYGWGHKYTKSLELVNYFYVHHETNVMVPLVHLDNEYSIGGTVNSYYTMNSKPVKGNATVEVELKVPGLEDPLPRLKETYGMIEGEFSFNFPMDRVREIAGDNIADTEVFVHANVYDWFSFESHTFSGYSKIVSSKYHMRFLGGKIRVFKPEQPFHLYIAMYTKDGHPITSMFNRMVRILITVRRNSGSSHKEEKTQVIGEDSMIHFIYNTGRDDQSLSIRVAYSSGRETSYEEVTAYRHYTQANQYLSVTSSTIQPIVDNYIVFTVRATTYVETIHYQVVAGGNIILGSQLFVNSQQKTFSLAASRAMVPEARIIVWTLLNSGEMITDSLSFHVDGIRSDEMIIRVNRGKDFSGDTVEINAFTDASAFSAFSVEQEKEYRLGWNSFFSKHMVEEDLMRYDSHANLSFKQTWWNDLTRPETIYFPAPSYAIDANTTFTFTGLNIVTDAGLTRIDAAESCNHTLGYLPCWDGGCYRIEEHCNGVRQCEDGADELGCSDPMEVHPDSPDAYNKTDQLWTNYRDKRTWVWKKFYTQPYGRIDFHVDVPIWPNRWLVSGFSLDREKGLSFTEIPVELDTTRSFFMIMEVPPACKRGEQLGVQMTVFNHWDQPMDAIIVLRDSSDYVFIRVEDFGIVPQYNPRTTRGDIQTMVTLQPGESKFVHFPILPLKVKTFKVTIEGHSFTNSMTISKSISVGWDGVRNMRHTPFLIDLVNSGSKVMPFLEIPIRQRFIDPGMRRHRYVPESAQVKVSIVGDVVGTGLYSSYLTAYKNFDGMMHGNGEQYLYNVATNIYWLRFMDTTNYLTTKTLNAALAGVNLELQQLYSYIQKDGGCAIRRKRPPSDVIFTSMALEHLSMAIKPEWESLLYVDVTILNRLAGWITQNQNVSTGAFWNPASWNYDLKMRGNLTNEYGISANISMTATAVIGLANARDFLSGETQSNAVAAVHQGTRYLEEWFPRLVDPFEICICAYAFEIARSNYRSASFAKMREIRREDNYVYWSPEKIDPNTVEYINAIPYQKYRQSSPPFQAKANQATAYALMVYLRNNWFRQSEPIMKWLNSQRNHFAAFDATTDSLIVQMALSEYGVREVNRHLHHMHITSEVTSSDNWSKKTVLDQSNYMTETTFITPEAWGAVTSNVLGTGIALYQMSATFNVEHTNQLRQPITRSFDLEIEDLVFKGRNSSHMEMNICVRWTATHLSPNSGDAILEIDIPTGYYVQKNNLRKYQRVGRIDSQRSRFSKQKVVLYFDYLDDVRQCFFFPAERWYPVANMTIQNRVSIYSSYEKGLFNNSMYTTYNLFHLHICQVCGSFQCPYCPFYNAADIHLVTSPLVIVIGVMAVMRELWR